MGEYSGNQEFKNLAKGEFSKWWGSDLNSGTLAPKCLLVQLQEFEERNNRGGKRENDLSIKAQLKTHFLCETLMNYFS